LLENCGFAFLSARRAADLALSFQFIFACPGGLNAEFGVVLSSILNPEFPQRIAP
jgi:hypothetical protein